MGDDAAGAASNESTSGMPPAIAGLSQGQQLLGLGAVIVIADYLLFNLIMEEYSFFTGTLLLAAYALFGLWVKTSRPGAAWPVDYGWLMKVIGLSAGFLAVIELLADLRIGILDNAGDIFGALIFYAGAALMAVGGQQSKVGS